MNQRLADQLAFGSLRVFRTFFWPVSRYRSSEISSVRSDSRCLNVALFLGTLCFLSLGARVPR